jgi:hypothetical protein
MVGMAVPATPAGHTRPGYAWLAIVASALVFGAGHLPAASALVGRLDVEIAVFVTGANTAFGLLFGYLFWRRGLESAMVAHALAHAVNYLRTSDDAGVGQRRLKRTPRVTKPRPLIPMKSRRSDRNRAGSPKDLRSRRRWLGAIRPAC